jgi:hypothetical protein
VTDLIQFQLFNVKTRRLQERRKQGSTIGDLDAQLVDDDGEPDADLGWVLGWHNHKTAYVNENGDVARIGDGGPLDPGK